MNFCVIQGAVVGDPRIAVLPSGETGLTFDVQTTEAGTNRTAVPVEWKGPASKMPNITPDQAVAVTGSVARRFYQSGGSTHTRVYIAPSRIVVRRPAMQNRLIGDALEEAIDLRKGT